MSGSGPTILARIPHAELDQLMRGYGWQPIFIGGHEPAAMHEAMAAALDKAVTRIQAIQTDARRQGRADWPCWPMIVLR